MADLPPFPVDDATLDMLAAAIVPDDSAEHSGLEAFLEVMSQLGGADTTAVEQEQHRISLLRDVQYGVGDVLAALIAEIRRLRGAQLADGGGS